MSLKRNIIIAVIVLAISITAKVWVNNTENTNFDETKVGQQAEFVEQMEKENGKDSEQEAEMPEEWVVIEAYTSGSFVNSKIIVESEKPFTLLKTTDEAGKVKYIVESHPGVEYIREGIDALAENFSYICMSDTIEEQPSDLSKYGLDTPQGKYTLIKEADGRATTVIIGDKIGSMYYAMVEGDPKVYTIFGAYGDAVLSGLNTYRETTLIDITSAEIAEKLNTFQIDSREKGCIVSIRQRTETDKALSNSKFIMTVPYELPVASSKFIQTFSSFSPLNVSEFIEDNPQDLSKYGLDNPAYTLTIGEKTEDGGEQTYVVHFGNLQEDGMRVYCMVEGKNFVFTTPKRALEAFTAIEPYVLCDRYVHLISINDISNIVITTADGSRNHTLNIAHKGDGYADLYLDGKPADDETFRDAYRYIVGIGFVADGGSSAVKQTEAVKIRFEFLDGTSYNYVYFEHDDRNYVVDRNGENTSFLVAKKSITQMFEMIDKVETY